jgi:high-affinity K+ transport system ATPase subunit B
MTPPLWIFTYLPDVVALVAFGVRRLLPDRRLAESLVDETANMLGCSGATVGSFAGVTDHVADRLEFEAVRKDVQTCSAVSLAGVVARAGTPTFINWALILTAAWIFLLIIANSLNVPVNGVRRRRSRRVVLIVLMLAYVGFSALGKYLSLQR